jgi:hypothetical protein
MPWYDIVFITIAGFALLIGVIVGVYYYKKQIIHCCSGEYLIINCFMWQK